MPAPGLAAARHAPPGGRGHAALAGARLGGRRPAGPAGREAAPPQLRLPPPPVQEVLHRRGGRQVWPSAHIELGQRQGRAHSPVRLVGHCVQPIGFLQGRQVVHGRVAGWRPGHSAEIEGQGWRNFPRPVRAAKVVQDADGRDIQVDGPQWRRLDLPGGTPRRPAAKPCRQAPGLHDARRQREAADDRAGGRRGHRGPGLPAEPRAASEVDAVPRLAAVQRGRPPGQQPLRRREGGRAGRRRRRQAGERRRHAEERRVVRRRRRRAGIAGVPRVRHAPAAEVPRRRAGLRGHRRERQWDVEHGGVRGGRQVTSSLRGRRQGDFQGDGH
mmetsp:Transcript_20190/g.60474  ORF Transcript_20190/g.60474 Transcript_20190/m.60474 type:complete len:328 (+) Transcript_20190:44-1027(+)